MGNKNLKKVIEKFRNWFDKLRVYLYNCKLWMYFLLSNCGLMCRFNNMLLG